MQVEDTAPPRTNMERELALTDAQFRAKYRAFRQTSQFSYRLRHFTKPADRVASAIENLFLGRKTLEPLDSPVFVTGNFRSGTSMLEKILADHPKLGYYNLLSLVFPSSPYFAALMGRVLPGFAESATPPHQPNLVIDATWPGECEEIWRRCRNNIFTDEPSNVLGADFRDERFEREFIQSINKHLICQGVKRFINKNPLNTLRVDYLARLFPDARFVHIVRHPYRLLKSQIDLQAMWARVLEPSGGRDYNEFFSDTFLPPKRLYPRTARWSEIIRTSERDRDLAFAMSIVDVEDALNEAVEASQLQERMCRVRYEDLRSRFEPEIEQIFEHIRLLDEDARKVIAASAANFLHKDLLSSVTPLPRFRPEVEGELKPFLEYYGFSAEEG